MQWMKNSGLKNYIIHCIAHSHNMHGCIPIYHSTNKSLPIGKKTSPSMCIRYYRRINIDFPKGKCTNCLWFSEKEQYHSASLTNTPTHKFKIINVIHKVTWQRLQEKQVRCVAVVLYKKVINGFEVHFFMQPNNENLFWQGSHTEKQS